MSYVILGGFIPVSAIKSKVTQKAQYKTEKRFSQRTGKRLKDAKVIVKPERVKFILFEKEYTKWDNYYFTRPDQVLNYLTESNNLKSKYTVHNGEYGAIIGFEIKSGDQLTLAEINKKIGLFCYILVFTRNIMSNYSF